MRTATCLWGEAATAMAVLGDAMRAFERTNFALFCTCSVARAALVHVRNGNAVRLRAIADTAYHLARESARSARGSAQEPWQRTMRAEAQALLWLHALIVGALEAV